MLFDALGKLASQSADTDQFVFFVQTSSSITYHKSPPYFKRLLGWNAADITFLSDPGASLVPG
jgi:hypothetical protein